MAPMELETDRGAERIWGYLATGNYFSTLGVQPALGRFFNQSDDLHPGASPYAVLSYSAWQSRFGADLAILGKTVRLNRLPYSVIGVAPPDFHGTELFYWPEVWVPMMMEPRIESNSWLDNRSTWNTWVVGRLKPNVSPPQAEADLNVVAAELARQYPGINDGLRFKLAKPGLVGNMIGGPAKAFAFGVLILAALVLLVACTNLASMFTARATERQREVAVRLAIGAGRGRVVRQVLTETLVLSLLGGAVGYLLASFLSLRGLQQALKISLGFQPERVAAAAFELNLAGYSDERGRAFQQQVLQAIQQLPGVQSASYSNSVPLSIDQSTTGVFPADKPDLRPSDRVGVTFYQVSPGFFATLGTKLLAGHEFTWHDDAKSRQVAIVNLAFAKRVLHTDNAVGKRFRGGVMGPVAEVIGVVEDGKYGSLTESQEAAVFWSILQSYNSTTTIEVKSSLSAMQMVSEIRQAIARLDPELPLYGVGSLEHMLGFAFFPTRAAAIALSAFGILAIMLATTGIHGLVAYAVSRRTHEIGIRMAIDSRPGEVLRLVLGKTAALLVLGSLVGLTLALAVGQAISSVVYEMQPRDPLVIVSAWIAIALLGLFASWSPARKK